MLKKLTARAFAAVPYLETSQLMQRHQGTIKFSTTKPNVIVGPNGSGKSALIEAIALRFLAQLTGVSCLDGKYTSGHESERLWSKKNSWGRDWEFLAGLEVATDNAPARYYRPAHIPGNEHDVTHAMMCGYFDEAKAFARLTEHKSSGQKSLALLETLLTTLAGEDLPSSYAMGNWRGGRERSDLSARWAGPWEYQAEVLKSVFADVKDGLPLVLMDEPEQSLDARAEMRIWRAIAAADCTRMQVIIATHSLYPLLHRDKFNVIQAAEGYAEEVLSMAQAPA